MESRYEIRIFGYLGPVLRAAVEGMRCEVVPRQTTIHGRLSPGELRRLLSHLDTRGLTLIHLARSGTRRRPDTVDDARSLSSTQGDASEAASM